MISHRYLLVCAILAIPTFARAQIVECLDSNGKKIYSQSCPTGTEKKREIDQPPPPKPNALKNDATKKSLDNQEKSFEKRREERLNAEAKDAAQQKKSADDAQQCESAKHMLEVLGSGRQSRRVDTETGDHVSMDDDQRLAEIDKLKAQIQATCQ